MFAAYVGEPKLDRLAMPGYLRYDWTTAVQLGVSVNGQMVMVSETDVYLYRTVADYCFIGFITVETYSGRSIFWLSLAYEYTSIYFERENEKCSDKG